MMSCEVSFLKKRADVDFQSEGEGGQFSLEFLPCVIGDQTRDPESWPTVKPRGSGLSEQC